MIAGLPVILIAGLGTIPSFEVGPRRTALLAVLAPSTSSADVSRLLRVGVSALERVGPFRGLSPEQAGLEPASFERCPSETQLACWVRSAQRTNASLLVLIRDQGRHEEGRALDVVGFDLEAAGPLVSTVTTDPDQLEDALFTMLRRTDDFVLPFRSERREVELLAERMEAGLSEFFRARAESLGEVTVHSRVAGTVVVVNGRILGKMAGPQVVLTRVPPGAQLMLQVGTVRHHCGELVGARVELAACQAADGSFAPDNTLGAVGVGVALGGVAALAAGLLTADQAPDRVCARGEVCAGLGWSGPFSTDPMPGASSAAFDEGPGWVPIGVGMAVAGAGLMSGGWLVEEDKRWWVSLGGAALGIAAGATVAAIGSSGP